MNPRVETLLDFRVPCDALRLESRIRSRCHGQIRDLQLELRCEGLILHGLAPSYYIKQLAQQAVLEAGELPLLANEIEVTIERETQ